MVFSEIRNGDHFTHDLRWSGEIDYAFAWLVRITLLLRILYMQAMIK